VPNWRIPAARRSGGVRWLVEPEGGKPIYLTAHGQEAIERQLEAFRKKFGRYPGPNDPVFFNPEEDTPVPLSDDEYDQAVLAAMAQAGLDPARIYAFKRTDRMVTEHNKHLLSKKQLQQWDDAISEYHRKLEAGQLI
jgi:hypothetical protein